MARQTVKPYLVAKNEAGRFSVTIRTTRFNSQGYPLVSSKKMDQTFDTATKARSWLRDEYRALATEIATA